MTWYYAVGYWNVEKEPVVVEIPPATADIIVFGTLFDAWQRPIIDVARMESTVAGVGSSSS
jgi:hypothetical protein